MKRAILIIITVAAFVAWARYFQQPHSGTTPPADSGTNLSLKETQSVHPISEAPKKPRSQAMERRSAIRSATERPIADDRLVLRQTIDALVSPQTTYAQRQAIWKQIKLADQLDQAIEELQQRVNDDPRSVENSANLGIAYYRKCGAIEDMREQAILAMKADQTLDMALQLDPTHWEAKFNKAVGMSYWPEQLNKRNEVVEHFRQLIQQQETQPAEPQFAKPYFWLGKEYQKAGRADYAMQVWQRGATLFPADADLKDKLNATVADGR
jgi:tetratricopeptide (TPR) repeat protein